MSSPALANLTLPDPAQICTSAPPCRVDAVLHFAVRARARFCSCNCTVSRRGVARTATFIARARAFCIVQSAHFLRALLLFGWAYLRPETDLSFTIIKHT